MNIEKKNESIQKIKMFIKKKNQRKYNFYTGCVIII